MQENLFCLRIFRRFEKFLMAAKKHPEAEEEAMEEAWDLYRCVFQA